MSGTFGPSVLAAAGTTGSNTHTQAGVSQVNAKLCAALIIEAVGGTPTVTAKVQGSLDPTGTADASSNWFDLPFITDTNDTVAATITKTATGTYPLWLSLSQIRFVRKIRLVTSANTNVTYRGELHQQYTS